MIRVFEFVFNYGMKFVIIIGIDCFGLIVDIMLEVFVKLIEFDVIIGLVIDGGYYLIVIKKNIFELF